MGDVCYSEFFGCGDGTNAALAMSLSGPSNIHHDIGGFFGPMPNARLLTSSALGTALAASCRA